MTLLEEIEEKVTELSEEDRAKLRDYLDELSEAAWDREIEQDFRAGRMDALIAQAIKDDDEGKSTPL